jgi:hypothetical protein
MTRTAGFASLLAGGLCACALEAAGPPDVAHETAPIAGGEVSTASDDAVVQTRVSFGRPCTGALLAPNVVLTALHCVSAFDFNGAYYCNSDGTPALVNPEPGRINGTLDPSKIEVYFGAEPGTEPSAFGQAIFGSGSHTICSDDIALVVLDRDLPNRGFSIRVDRPVNQDDELTLFGYGGPTDSLPRQRRKHARVLGVGPDQVSEAAGVLPRAFLVGDGPCDGDEGGPAVSEETGAVVGLFSFTASGHSSDCEGGQQNIYTKVVPFRDLVEDALASVGRVPRVEGETAVSDADATAGGCSFAPAPVGVLSTLLPISVLLVPIGRARLRRRQSRLLGCTPHRRG